MGTAQHTTRAEICLVWTKEFGRTIIILIFALTEQLQKTPTDTLKIPNFSLKLKLVES